MKVKLLKELRVKTLRKYDIRNWSNIAGCKDKPWRIGCGVKNVLAYHEYATKEEATKALRMLWHEEAEKYLWEHKLERKCNKYLW